MRAILLLVNIILSMSSSSSAMQTRLAAKEFAREIVKTMDQIAEPDRPYMEAVVVEAVLFEEPLKDLKIGLSSVGPHYNVTIVGYENLIDLVRWVNTFMSMDRNPLLCHVTHTFVQMPPDKGAMMVVQMNKLEFHRAGMTNGDDHTTVGGAKKFRKRT